MHTAGPFPAAIYRPPGAPCGVVPAVVLTRNTTPMTKTRHPNRSLGPPAIEEAGALRPCCPLRSGSVCCRGPRRLMVMRNLHDRPWNLESRPLMARRRSSSVYRRGALLYTAAELSCIPPRSSSVYRRPGALYLSFRRKQAEVAPPCLTQEIAQSVPEK